MDNHSDLTGNFDPALPNKLRGALHLDFEWRLINLEITSTMHANKTS